MKYTKDFSIIIPVWRGAISFLPKLFDSIPENDGIEIIVVDNSNEPVRKEEIDSKRKITFLHSAPERHAGGSRNDGVATANGKWLLFADADDFFTHDAFDIYYSMIDSDAEIVYTGMGGVYEDTGERSDRGDYYARLVHGFCEGIIPEEYLRLGFASPCCKMVSHELVNRHQIKYDEIRAGNDMYFSLVSGFYAKSIAAVDRITYIATVNKGSLTKRRDYEVVKSRLYCVLHCNQFLKAHGHSDKQQSVMFALAEAPKFGFRAFFEMFGLILKYHQNPFIGWRRWARTRRRNRNDDKNDKKYIVK